jgi:hypothetical protein
MLEPALDAGVPRAWVAGDTVHGADGAPRRAIEAPRGARSRRAGAAACRG